MTPLKSLLDLWSRLAYTFPETNPKTLAKAQAYAKSHGIQFLTNMLPQLGKLVDQALSSGLLHPSLGFRTKKGSNLPIFMHEWFTLFFHNDGVLKEDFDPALLRIFRTLLFMFYKYELPFSDDQLAEAREKFIQTDSIVKMEFESIHLLMKSTFKELLPDDPKDIVAKHSPGATTDGFNNIDKRIITRFIPSLHSVYGFEYFYNTRHLFEIDKSNIIKWGVTAEPSMTVTFVPKDSRGPRTICMEVHERMSLQLGLMKAIYQHIENFSNHAGRINFSDQSINQVLAHKASHDQTYATIDLKDASDLVSWNLILDLVPTEYRSVLTALRTPTVRFGRDGEPLEINKFAPMGSALCFPIEAILFYSIARTITPDVYVYGDDIIVPTSCAVAVMDALESYGLAINRDKSLLNGYFRESCGHDAYKGNCISPIRYRRDDYASVVAFANNIREAFGDKHGECVIRWYESIVPLIIPRTGLIEHPVGFISYNGGFNNLCLFKRRYNRLLHRYEYRVLTTTVTSKRQLNDDARAYHEWLNTKDGYICPASEIKYCEPFKVHKNSFMHDISSRFSLEKDRLKWKWVSDY